MKLILRNLEPDPAVNAAQADRSPCRLTADQSPSVASGTCVKIWFMVINIIKGPALHCGSTESMKMRLLNAMNPQGHLFHQSRSSWLCFAVLKLYYSHCTERMPLALAACWDVHSEPRWEEWKSKPQRWGDLLTVCFQPYERGHRRLQVPQPARITVGQRQKWILWHLRAQLYRLIAKPLRFPEGKEKYGPCCARCLCAPVSLSWTTFQRGLGWYSYTGTYTHTLVDTPVQVDTGAPSPLGTQTQSPVTAKPPAVGWQLGIQKQRSSRRHGAGLPENHIIWDCSLW